MKLSVVIPTHNRAEPLAATLEALAGQTLPREDYEIVVVDDGSEEETRRRIRAYRERYDFELVEKEQGGLASARNRGADAATGEIILFLDDDVIPGPATLEQHLASHAAADTPVVVLGSLPYPDFVPVTTFLWYLERSTHFDLFKDPHKYPGGKPPMPPLNGNSSVDRRVFLDAGKYDATFKQYGGEDLELGYRLARRGIEFVYNPEAVGYHNHIKSFRQFCVDQERAGESLIQLYRMYPEIKVPKKIDIVADPIATLPGRKKLMKIIMSVSMALPWILAVPRAVIGLGARFYGLRRVLFPMYRWLGHYHYAVGMKRGLATGA